jgi:hypothetical protein
MINANAMQSYKGTIINDQNTKALSMGSWHADLSKEGIYVRKSQGSPKKKQKASIFFVEPPRGGWVAAYGADPRAVNASGRKVA